MAKKKEAEGIALLSMYNDEDMDVDDDDEEEDEEKEEEEEEQRQQHQEDGMHGEGDDSTENMSGSDSAPENPGTSPLQPYLPDEDEFTLFKSPKSPSQRSYLPSPSPPPPAPLPPPPLLDPDVQRIQKGPLVIVDYAHDETAMSPETEEGEIPSTGRVMFGEELPIANGNFQEKTPPGTVQILTPNWQTTPQPSSQAEQLKSDIVTATSYVSPREPETDQITEVGDTAAVEGQRENLDPLEKFLPPPLSSKCSAELQERICKYLGLKRSGRSFNEDLRNSKGYRNPDFLQHAVWYQDIDQIGTCFSKDVFDPHGYNKSDYYDEIEADMKREMERRDQEKKRNQKVEFIQGSTQPGSVLPAPKIGTQIPGVPSAAATGLHSVSTDARDSRQNKKTKWDKVDGDKRNPLPSGGQDALSAAGAVLLSAANAGAGYTAFAQQKRREAEEKRSSERKVEKRS